MSPVYTCGDRGVHWYGAGDICACGQVPNHLLAAPRCDCGGTILDPPLHEPSCRVVRWVMEREAWVTANPHIDPPLPHVEREVRNATPSPICDTL